MMSSCRVLIGISRDISNQIKCDFIAHPRYDDGRVDPSLVYCSMRLISSGRCHEDLLLHLGGTFSNGSTIWVQMYLGPQCSFMQSSASWLCMEK
jgi:hypothetical protein